MHRHLTLFTLGLLASACATSGGASSSVYPDFDTSVLGEATDPALTATLYDESEAYAAVAFVSEDGVLSGKAAGSAAATVRANKGGYEVEVPLGDAAPVRCVVQSGVIGLSAFARSLAETYLFSYDAHELKYVFAGAKGGLPVLIVHGQYIDPGTAGGARKTGFMKLVVAGRAESTVACLHDQFGYRETLERVTRSLTESLQWKRPGKPLLPLRTRLVYTITKDGRPAGVQELIIRADDEDFRSSWIRTALLSLSGPQRLLASDTLETYESDPDGLVIRQTYQARKDGALRVDLKVAEAPMPGYEVTGTIADKAVEARFEVVDGLPDPRGMAAARANAKGFARYLPELNPSKASTCAVKRAGEGVEIKCSAVGFTASLDEAGFWRRASRADGYVFERVAP